MLRLGDHRRARPARQLSAVVLRGVSTTITSPGRSSSANPANAQATHSSMRSSLFRKGITIETHGRREVVVAARVTVGWIVIRLPHSRRRRFLQTPARTRLGSERCGSASSKGGRRRVKPPRVLRARRPLAPAPKKAPRRRAHRPFPFSPPSSSARCTALRGRLWPSSATAQLAIPGEPQSSVFPRRPRRRLF